MKYPLIFFAFILLVIIGFSLIFTNYESAPQRLNKVMASTEELDDCYDDTMTTWFEEFNTSQEEGVTMEEADELAAEKALDNFEECSADTY